jgi:hypothetical protein
MSWYGGNTKFSAFCLVKLRSKNPWGSLSIFGDLHDRPAEEDDEITEKRGNVKEKGRKVK